MVVVFLAVQCQIFEAAYAEKLTPVHLGTGSYIGNKGLMVGSI